MTALGLNGSLYIIHVQLFSDLLMTSGK